MAAQPITHPSADALRAFALGKLNDASTAALMNHLDGCPDCCKQVAALSGDDFLKRLRQARSHSNTPTPAKASSETSAGAKPSPKQTPLANLPPELADNPQYQIVRELGRGGMGVVYLAKNKLMDRFEVLKVVNKKLLDHPGAAERFLREIRSAAKLSHANVVGAYSAVQLGELLAFAMEYIEGQDLASVVQSKGPLPIQHACYYVQQAALGLQHAFEKGMVHRDIKPQNLILSREGKKHIVKVLDFGLAKATREKKDDTGLTGEGKMLGTPDYIAPEQTMDAAKADIRADIYSLGCTLYYLLSGHPPFSASSLGAILMAHQMHEAKPLNLVRPEVPEELAAVVRKMMAKSPAKRYQTPLDVVQALAPFVKPGATAKPSSELSSGTAASKPAAKQAAPVPPPSSPPIEKLKQQPAPAALWESLTENSAASIVRQEDEIVHKPRAAGKRRRSSKKWLIGGGLGVGVLLLALFGMWAGGMLGGKVQVKTKEGLLIVEVNEPNPEILVDGETVTVSWRNGGKKAEIRVQPGTRTIEVRKDGFSIVSKELTFKDGDSQVFTARLLPNKADDQEQQRARDDTPSSEKLPLSDKADAKIGQSQSSLDRTNEKQEVPPTRVSGGETNGFVPLFNDRDLAGWSVDQGDAKQWSVEDDAIVGRSKHWTTLNYLLTDKEYADFVLRFEYKVEDDSHGGVAIRAIEGERLNVGNRSRLNHPLIKLTKPAMENGEKTGTTHFLKSAAINMPPVEDLALPTRIWQLMEIIVKGDNCTATVGGKKVVDVTLDPDPRNRGNIVPGLGRRKGKVGFQINTGTVRYRNIKIKELSPAVKATTEEKGFVPLFNGKTLRGWKTHPKQPGNWRVVNGVLIGSGPSITSHLYTVRGDYTDFHLRLEARINEGGNSGVYFRTPFGPVRPANQPRWLNGYNAKIDTNRLGGFLLDHPTGNLPLVRSRDPSIPAREWLTLEVIVQANHVVVKTNGETTAEYTDEKRCFEKGHIALQQHTPQTLVEFRKIEIKELPVAKAEAPATAGAAVPPSPPRRAESSQRAKRIDRWAMQWDVKNSREYVTQLRGLGVILAIPVGEGANGPEYEIVRDLSARPAKLVKEEIEEIQRKEFWIDDKPDSVQSVMSVLGLRLRPSHFIAIFTEEVEKKLLHLETDYLKQRHPGRSEDDIALTTFTVKVKGGEYVPEVVKQRLK